MGRGKLPPTYVLFVDLAAESKESAPCLGLGWRRRNDAMEGVGDVLDVITNGSAELGLPPALAQLDTLRPFLEPPDRDQSVGLQMVRPFLTPPSMRRLIGSGCRANRSWGLSL